MYDDLMADQLTIELFARRYNIKTYIWLPPLAEGLAACNRSNAAYRPVMILLPDAAPKRYRSTAYLLQSDINCMHFEPVIPTAGSRHEPGRFKQAGPAREGYDPALHQEFTTPEMRRKVCIACIL